MLGTKTIRNALIAAACTFTVVGAIPTADAGITEKGLAYITDIGMVGPIDSIIGVEKKSILESFLKQTNFKLEVAGGRCIFNAVMIEITGRTRSASIELIQMAID